MFSDKHRNTMGNWEKQGRLTPYKINGRVYYSRADIERRIAEDKGETPAAVPQLTEAERIQAAAFNNPAPPTVLNEPWKWPEPTEGQAEIMRQLRK